MKTVIPLLLLTSLLCHSEEVEWQTHMIQIQFGGATGTPERVDDEGSQPSLPIGENGSRFELWGWRLVDGQLETEELLDTTDVGVYLPTAEIDITTADPFADFHRSRIDKPFSVNFSVENLLGAAVEDVPDAAKRVYVEHWADLHTYTDGSYDDSSVESSTLVQSFYMTAEEPEKLFNFPVTNIVADDLVRRSGKERFIVYALADDVTPMREIASNEIVILPYPEGNLAGLDESESYTFIPDFTASVHRAYPGGETWVEVISGGYSAGQRGTQLSGPNYGGGRDVTGPSMQLSFSNFPDSIQPRNTAEMTFVLRTSAPFPGESYAEGGRVLDTKTINVTGMLRVNAMVTDME